MILEAPFPWFGGKRRVAAEVWARFGAIDNYVEPFFGSGAVLLGRPGNKYQLETVNDIDGYVCNFWRAIQHSPNEVARWADNPVNENDLHARHIWLVQRKGELVAQLECDPGYHDARIAGYWVWGMACWIGGEFCSGKGPWQAQAGRLVKAHRGDSDQGVRRKRVQLETSGQGVRRGRIALHNAGQGIMQKRAHVETWFRALAQRLRDVRVCCGDWSRVCGPTPTHLNGLTGVFLDPPYADTAERDPNIYSHESASVAHDVCTWALEAGENPLMRIALCGYEGEHVMPRNWAVYQWKAPGGYANQGSGDGQANAHKERIWFSPACLGTRQNRLFNDATEDGP